MMDGRRATVRRETRETQIVCTVNLDGLGESEVRCEVGFFTHMLETLARHGHLDLDLDIRGDLHVDQHHTVEDTGLVLGQAIREALGDRRGIWRTGWCRFPMDEALAEAAIDIAGRPHLHFSATFGHPHVGGMRVDLVREFFAAVAQGLGANLHLDLVRAQNDHHAVECLFKAFARALELAVRIHPRAARVVPSTKGTLDG